MAKTCATMLNRLPFTLYYIVTFLFVLKSHNYFRKKGEKKGMHCWDSNQGPLTYKKVEKKKDALPRFELGTSGLQRQCSNHYITETSQLHIFNSVLYSWRLLALA